MVQVIIPNFREEDVMAFSFNLPSDWNFRAVKEYIVEFGQRTPFGFIDRTVTGASQSSVSVITLERYYPEFIKIAGELMIEIQKQIDKGEFNK
jgi:hypothetical protein